MAGAASSSRIYNPAVHGANGTPGRPSPSFLPAVVQDAAAGRWRARGQAARPGRQQARQPRPRARPLAAAHFFFHDTTPPARAGGTSTRKPRHRPRRRTRHTGFFFFQNEISLRQQRRPAHPAARRPAAARPRAIQAAYRRRAARSATPPAARPRGAGTRGARPRQDTARVRVWAAARRCRTPPWTVGAARAPSWGRADARPRPGRQPPPRRPPRRPGKSALIQQPAARPKTVQRASARRPARYDIQAATGGADGRAARPFRLSPIKMLMITHDDSHPLMTFTINTLHYIMLTLHYIHTYRCTIHGARARA